VFLITGSVLDGERLSLTLWDWESFCGLYISPNRIYPTIYVFAASSLHKVTQMSAGRTTKASHWHSKRKRRDYSVDTGEYNPSAHLQKKIDFNTKCQVHLEQQRETYREIRIQRSLKEAYQTQKIVMRETEYPFPVIQRTLQIHGPSCMRGRKQLLECMGGQGRFKCRYTSGICPNNGCQKCGGLFRSNKECILSWGCSGRDHPCIRGKCLDLLSIFI
jgi:hypothetical protein